MTTKSKVREILFSGTGPIGIDTLISSIKTVAHLANDLSVAEKELIVAALKHCLNNRTKATNQTHQLVKFIDKLGSNEKKDVKRFLLLEIKEVLEATSKGTITKDQLENNYYNKEFKQLLSTHSKDIKAELKRLLIEKFKDNYIDKTIKKLKTLDKDITPYALVRFLREDRTPSISYLEDLFEVLEIESLTYLESVE